MSLAVVSRLYPRHAINRIRGEHHDRYLGLKQESEVPLRSHGSLSMNRALMAAGLVDRVQ